jgi:phage-related protein
MARFDVSYTITAIDKFSEVTERLKQQLNSLRSTVEKISVSTSESLSKLHMSASEVSRSVGANFESLKNTIVSVDTNIGMSLIKLEGQFNKLVRNMSEALKGMQTNLIDRSITIKPINFKPAKDSITKFNEWAGKMAFSGYINSMNVAMPILALFMKPFKELKMQESALSTLTSAKGIDVSSMKALADSLAKATTFSSGTVMTSEALLASKGAGEANIKKLIPVILNIAASTKEDIKTVTNQVSQAIFDIGKVSGVGDILVTGLTQAERIKNLVAQASSKFATAAVDQGSTMTGRLTRAFNSLNDALSKFLTAATPAFETLSSVILKASTAIADFSSKHKELIKAITAGALIVIGFVAASVLFGAVMVAAGFALKGARLAMILFRIATFNGSEAIKILKGITVAFTASQGILRVVTERLSDSYLALGLKYVYAGVKLAVLTTATLAYRTALIVLRGALIAANGIMAAFNLLMELNPIVAIITAIAAAGFAIYEFVKHWKSIKDTVYSVCTAVGGMINTYLLHPLKAVVDYIKGTFMSAFSAVHSVVSAIAHPFSSAYESVKGLFGGSEAHTPAAVSHSLNKNVNVNHVHLYTDGVKHKTVTTAGSTHTIVKAGTSSMLRDDVPYGFLV